MNPERLPERLMPLAVSQGVSPWYGDIHNHCALSYGHGALETALQNAALQLDFVSITGHAAWPDMPVDEPSVAHIVAFHVEGFARLERDWQSHFARLARANREGEFTVFPGYEIHSSEHGDYTIVYADLDASPMQLADTPAELKQRLQSALGDRAFAFPHHIGYRQGARGINWDSFDEALSPMVEMFSMHGCAENSDALRPYLHSMGPCDGASTLQAGLARGHRFGIVGNTDHHSAFPGSYGHGRTAVYARDGSREAIWQGLRARHTNALTGDRTHLLAMIGDAIPGDAFSPTANGELAIEAVAGGSIDLIDVFHNGQLVHRITPTLTPSPIDAGSDGMIETVLALELGWGARNTAHHWQGTLRLQGGEILALEPRLRGPEVVSPLEGEADEQPLPSMSLDEQGVRFSVVAHANPNNTTCTTQGLAARVRLSPDAVIEAELCGQRFELPTARLFNGAVSGNLGIIDTPAWRFSALPTPEQWQWQGRVPMADLTHKDTLYVRLRQHNGQISWTSPLFCR